MAELSYEIQLIKGVGRALFATKPIPQGHIIVQEQPYCSKVFPDTTSSYCDCCFNKLPTVIVNAQQQPLLRCGGCKSAYYTSKQHQRIAWRNGHKEECAAIQSLAPKHPSPTILLALKTVIKAFQNNELQSEPENPNTYYNNTHSGYPGILSLLSHWEDCSDTGKIRYAQMGALGFQLLTTVNSAAKLITPRDMAYLIARIEVNAHTICDEEIRSVGIGVYPFISMVNHSCQPNAVQSFVGSTMIVRAVKDIGVGEEISIPYVELASTRWERRGQLLSAYMFDIDLPSDTPSDTPSSSTNSNSVSTGIKQPVVGVVVAPSQKLSLGENIELCIYNATSDDDGGSTDNNNSSANSVVGDCPWLNDGERDGQFTQLLFGETGEGSGLYIWGEVKHVDDGGDGSGSSEEALIQAAAASFFERDEEDTPSASGNGGGGRHMHIDLGSGTASVTGVSENDNKKDGSSSSGSGTTKKKEQPKEVAVVHIWHDSATSQQVLVDDIEEVKKLATAYAEALLTLKSSITANSLIPLQTAYFTLTEEQINVHNIVFICRSTPPLKFKLGQNHILRLRLLAAIMKATIDRGTENSFIIALKACRALMPVYEFAYPTVWPALGLHYATAAKLEHYCGELETAATVAESAVVVLTSAMGGETEVVKDMERIRSEVLEELEAMKSTQPGKIVDIDE